MVICCHLLAIYYNDATLCAYKVRFVATNHLCTKLCGGVIYGCFHTHANMRRACLQDFKEQVIHHIATLTLLAFSWISNYIRVGTIVMALHDSADILLEGAKVLNYAKWHQTANAMFVVFTFLFMLTRLVLFPFWVIHCTWVYPLERFAPFFGYYFFNAMLIVLLMLHFYWAVLISKMLYKCIFTKVGLHVYALNTFSTSLCAFFPQLEGDDRSDEEEDDSDSPKEKNYKLSHLNGAGARGRANGH
uniref:ceramide synthase 2 n=1 Tax=Doryrhamphus excisus TaxID=161450 RepID=UPI0025AECCA8|nr:ceramide synthase 2 [Doryrhamphus excisus]